MIKLFLDPMITKIKPKPNKKSDPFPEKLCEMLHADKSLAAKIIPFVSDKSLGAALCLAAMEGDLDIIDTLCKNEIDVNNTDASWTALHCAIVFSPKVYETVKKLLELGANPNVEDDNHKTPLSKELEKYNPSITVIELFFDPKVTKIKPEPKHKSRPFVKALYEILHTNESLVTKIMPFVKEKSLSAALCFAIEKKDFALAEILRKNGAMIK